MDRYQRAVYATAYRHLGNDAEAQEVCQEIFLRAVQKIGQLRQPECFGGSLRSMAARMAINRAVPRRRLVSGDDSVAEVCTRQPTPLGEMFSGSAEPGAARPGGSAPWIARRWSPSTSTAARCWR